MEGIHLHSLGFPSKFRWSSPVVRRNGSIQRSNLAFGFPSLMASADKSSVSVEKKSVNWESEFLGVVDSPSSELAKKKKRDQSRLLKDTDSMDWCVNARRSALRTIEGKGLMRKAESIVVKRKKKPKNNKEKSEKRRGSDVSDNEFDDAGAEDIDVESISDDLSNKIGLMAEFEEKREKIREAFIEKLSQFSGPSDRRKEISLNRAIVDAQTAKEVLEIVAETMSAVAKGLKPSPLTPLNISTGLHRIAKNMEKVSLIETRRLAFARQREMSMLVGIAMAALPECSAQGISNIAWALSKIGGDMLYLSEMDRIGEVAVTKVGDFNAQNVANVAGAFASMRQSAPYLFRKLSKRASELVRMFQEQELAQVLWAFASLNEPADELLDALDDAFVEYVSPGNHYLEDDLTSGQNGGEDETSDGIENIEDLDMEINVGPPTLCFSRDQLGNIAWSLAVLGQMDRAFFVYVWSTLGQLEMQKISEQHRNDVLFISQVLLVNQFLKLEYPHLNLTLNEDLEEKISGVGRTRRFNQKISSAFQKEVARLLVSTGLDWVREYVVDGYTMDAVLVERKLAFEIDGPTHFSRNLGTPLGHTVLKRRYMAAAGWKVVALSYQEWEELQGEFEQLEYLRRILGINPSNHLDEETFLTPEQK